MRIISIILLLSIFPTICSAIDLVSTTSKDTEGRFKHNILIFQNPNKLITVISFTSSNLDLELTEILSKDFKNDLGSLVKSDGIWYYIIKASDENEKNDMKAYKLDFDPINNKINIKMVDLHQAVVVSKLVVEPTSRFDVYSEILKKVMEKN